MDKYENAFNNAHGMEFIGFRFDEPDYEALVVTEENYLEMLKIQAAGIAYYGNLARKAESEYREMQRRYDARYAELYDICSSTIRKIGQKDNANNIKSLMNTKYEKELEEWNARLNELRSNMDGVTSYFEAWKAKGFTLNAMTQLITVDYGGIRTAITENDIEKANEKRMNVSKAGNILSSHSAFMNK